MKKHLIGVLVSFGIVGMSHAGGDVAAGQSKSGSCVACHGQTGNSSVPSFPKIAGQNERYLLKQLKNIQCGELTAEAQKASKCMARPIAQMTGLLANYDDQDLADIAAYFAAQEPAGGQANSDKELLAKGAEIYSAGIRSKGVAACAACHSPTGKGNAPAGFPRLSGQHSDYTVAQLKAFRAGADGDHNGRVNDGESKMMRDNAYLMSDNEIDAVANYIQGLY